MVNYFGFTTFSLYREYFLAQAEKELQAIKLKQDLEQAQNTPVNAVPAIAATEAIAAGADNNPPPLPNSTPAFTESQSFQPTPPPIPMNDKPIGVSSNIKVINTADEYGNFNQLGIVSNVLDPKKDEQAAGISQKKYFVKMQDGKTYPYYRNEIELFN